MQETVLRTRQPGQLRHLGSRLWHEAMVTSAFAPFSNIMKADCLPVAKCWLPGRHASPLIFGPATGHLPASVKAPPARLKEAMMGGGAAASFDFAVPAHSTRSLLASKSMEPKKCDGECSLNVWAISQQRAASTCATPGVGGMRMAIG